MPSTEYGFSAAQLTVNQRFDVFERPDPTPTPVHAPFVADPEHWTDPQDRVYHHVHDEYVFIDDWELLNQDERQEQEHHYAVAVHNLGNLNVFGTAELYVQRFGIMSALEPYGTRIWATMVHFFCQYRYRYRFDLDNLAIEWFVNPVQSWGRAAALQPVGAFDLRTLPRNAFFPCVFDITSHPGWEMEVVMACHHIILRDSRPWRVHRTRMYNITRLRLP